MPDERVYRSITLVLQNDTHGEFLVDGHATIHGEWESEPNAGDIVKPQSTAKWRILSHAEQQGASGFVHLNFADGEIKISINRPWAGETHIETQLPEGYSAQTLLDKENPDHPVVIIEIRTSARK